MINLGIWKAIFNEKLDLSLAYIQPLCNFLTKSTKEVQDLLDTKRDDLGGWRSL